MSVAEALRGGTVVWGAPTYDQVYTAWEETIHAASGVAVFNESRMTATFPGRGRILFRSLDDPDNARSKTANGVVIDEAGDVQEKAWKEVLRPMLMDTHGWALIIGTPKGRNWFCNEYTAIVAGERPDSMAWQIPSLGVRITPKGLERAPHPYENPNLAFAEVEAMYRDMSEMRFRQEILAEFLEDAGGVFRGVVGCATGEIEKPRAGTFVMGVDWGKSNDFTVLALEEAKTGKFVDFDRFNQISWPFQRKRLWEMYRRWTEAGAYVTIRAEENNIGEAQIEELRLGDKGENIPPLYVESFLTTNSTKQRIVEGLVLAIENRRVSYPNDPRIVNELQAYEKKKLSSGLFTFSAPDELHDDVVMAMCIAHDGCGGTSSTEAIPPVRTGAQYGQGVMV